MNSRILFFVFGFVFITTNFLYADCEKFTNPDVDISSYYSSAYGKTGQNLRTALHYIIKGHKKYTYKCVWEILKYTDEDPENTDNIIALYTQRSIPKSDKDSGQNDPNSCVSGGVKTL